MNRPTRFYLALHATLAAAMVGAMALHLAPVPAHWPALAQRPVWTVWVLIGLWLALSAAGVALRPLPLWRVAMGAAGAALLALGLGGLVLFLVLTLLAAGASYHFFEFPMRRWIRALGQPARGIR